MARQRFAVALSFALIVAATLTSGGRDEGVRWSIACLTCSETWLADAISNVALFVPLAMSLAWRGVAPNRERVRGAWTLDALSTGRVMLLCSVLSFVIESAQYVGAPSGRTASLADWMCNSAGAVVGVCMARWWARMVWPNTSRARALTAAWTLLAVLGLTASSVALSPRVPSVGATSAVRVSALPYTPGYGWFAALPDSAFVNGVPVPHGGNGPVIVEMDRTDTVRATVRVHGRDSRTSTVPIVFVYRARDREVMAGDRIARLPKPRGFAHLLLAQRGDDAVLQSALRAHRYGLATPVLVARDAFAHTNESAAADSAYRWLAASVSDRQYTLSVRSNSDSTTQMLTLSPAIGWALIQTVVGLDSRVAPLLCVVWLLAWFAPLGYWLTFASMDERVDGGDQATDSASGPRNGMSVALRSATVGSVTLLTTLWLVATWCGSPRLTLTDTALSALGVLLGALTALRVYTRRKPLGANSAKSS